MRKLTFIILTGLFLFVSIISKAQKTEFKGSVIDANTGKGLNYSTIIVNDKYTGTYSKEAGNFKLSNAEQQDSIIVSCLGYETQRLKIADIMNKPIALIPKTYSLQEYTVIKKQKKKKSIILNRLSNQPKNDYNYIIGVTYNNIGIAPYAITAKYFPNDTALKNFKYIKQVGFIENCKMYQWGGGHNYSPDWKCRIRIYQVDSSLFKMPGKDLLTTDVIVSKRDVRYREFGTIEELKVLDKLKIEDRAKYKETHPVTTYGYLYVDLSQFKISFPETGVFVAIEYLGASAPGAFYLCGKMQGKCWAVEDGVWKLFYGNSPAISLELAE